MSGKTVVELQGNVLEWCGLKLLRTPPEDYFEARGGPFEWEVDASLDEDDEYEARVSWKGVKLVSGRGTTRHAALTNALQELAVLESKIGNEVAARKEGSRVFKKNHSGGARAQRPRP
jgi:hypothetical protein